MFNIYQFTTLGKYADCIGDVPNHGAAIDAIEKMEAEGKEGYAVSALHLGKGAVAETKGFAKYNAAAEKVQDTARFCVRYLQHTKALSP